jgi:Tol biopolymer transport system component
MKATDIKQLTGNSGATRSEQPKWSPNGKQTTFESDRDGTTMRSTRWTQTAKTKEATPISRRSMRGPARVSSEMYDHRRRRAGMLVGRP